MAIFDDAVVLAQGDEVEAVEELDREGLDEIAVEVLGLEVDVGDAVALGQSADVPVAGRPSYSCSCAAPFRPLTGPPG